MSPINSTTQQVIDDLNLDVRAMQGVTQDSRQVQDGYLFAALQGALDGRSFIPEALMRGASVILSDSSVSLEDGGNARLITDDCPRQVFAHIVAAYYAKQPDHMVAVTGTNGKSSVVHFIDQIWRSIGLSSSYLGTLSGTMTTPEPVLLHEALSQMQEEGITHTAMEASSHGLEQYRMDGVSIGVAAFTSFSQDHLDYHSGMDEYFEAKKRLFSDVLREGGIAVLNADIPQFHALKSVCDARNIKVVSYGVAGEAIKLTSCVPDREGQRVTLVLEGEELSFLIPLVGKFQVMNVLCALGCVLSYGANVSACLDAVKEIKGVPGRLQHVQSACGNYNAYVDYAHTPDALDHVLNALRPHVSGKLICVFGAGGDRDVDKRSKMGAVVARLADIGIVTDDNPRSEDPQRIRNEILHGMNSDTCEVLEISDRCAAIEKAISMMAKGDSVLIAGKGHEQGQVFATATYSFDDVVETENAMRKFN